MLTIILMRVNFQTPLGHPCCHRVDLFMELLVGRLYFSRAVISEFCHAGGFIGDDFLYVIHYDVEDGWGDDRPCGIPFPSVKFPDSLLSLVDIFRSCRKLPIYLSPIAILLSFVSAASRKQRSYAWVMSRKTAIVFSNFLKPFFTLS